MSVHADSDPLSERSGFGALLLRQAAADSLAFAEALLDPPEPTEYLIAAMRLHRELVESGELSVDETTCAGLSYPAKTPEV